MARTSTILFLHGGPGLDSDAERFWFGESLPIDWWDQPRHEGSGNWHLRTVAAATSRVRDMAARLGRPIGIVAHSYGGLIAQQVADALPECISELVLLSPGVSLPQQYLRIARHLSAQHADATGSDLRSALATAEAEFNLQALFGIAGAVAALPQWRRLYFGLADSNVYTRYTTLRPDGARLDVLTFAQGVSEHLAHPPEAPRSRFSGPVRVIVGRDDVLLDRAAVAPHWSSVFPQAHWDEVDTGHMVHLELAPLAWQPKV